MYRSHSDYHHKPYRNQTSGSDIFFVCAKWYIAIFTIAFITVWFTNQPFFQFKNIDISGSHSSDVKEIEKIVQNPMTTKKLFFWNVNNFALYPKNKVEEQILKLDSKIASVGISLNRQSLEVVIKEYEPSMRYCIPALSRVDSNVVQVDKADENSTTTSESLDINSSSTPSEVDAQTDPPSVSVPSSGEESGLKEIPLDTVVDDTPFDCYWADENSYIFAKSPSYSGLPIFTIIENDPAKSKTLFQEESPIGKNIYDKERFTTIKTITNLLQYSGLYVKQAQNLPNDDINLSLGYPWIVTMNIKRSPEDSVDNLLLALKELKITATSSDSRIKHIDVRFGNKVFYK